jgi:hypothetical protein
MSGLQFEIVARDQVNQRTWREHQRDILGLCKNTKLCRENISVETHLTQALTKANLMVLAERLGAFVGFALVEVGGNRDDAVYMSTLFALNAGTAIIDVLVKYLTTQLAHPPKYLTLEATLTAATFYQRLGFYYYRTQPKVSYRKNKGDQLLIKDALTKWRANPSDESMAELKTTLGPLPSWNDSYETLAMVLPLSLD